MLSLTILRGKEDISWNWGFEVSLPTRLGNNCSLMIFSHISKFSIVLDVVVARNERFSLILCYSRHKIFGGRF